MIDVSAGAVKEFNYALINPSNHNIIVSYVIIGQVYFYIICGIYVYISVITFYDIAITSPDASDPETYPLQHYLLWNHQ